MSVVQSWEIPMLVRSIQIGRWTTPTEIRASYLEISLIIESIGGTDFGEVRVELDNGDVYLGADDSRQSNELSFTMSRDSLSKAITWTIIFDGVEQESHDVFNLFVQHTETDLGSIASMISAMALQMKRLPLQQRPFS
jgi:hypothetical protein